MKLSELFVLLAISVFISPCFVHAQQTPGAAAIVDFPAKLLKKISSKSSAIDRKLEMQTERYLKRFAKREQRLKRQLFKKDSAAAAALFNDTTFSYTTSGASAAPSQYFPYVDSVKGALNFLNTSPDIISPGDIAKKIEGSLNDIKTLEARLKGAEDIQAFIKQRKQQIKETLSRYTSLPKRLTKTYNDYTREAYYYAAQVNAYKEILNDPGKIERKALDFLSRIPAFKDFMQKHSFLSSLFGGVPENYGTPAALSNLQTRAQVQGLVNGRLAMGGPNAQNVFDQNIQAAQSQIAQLRDQVSRLGGSNADIDLPDFTPNTQRTKSFLQRIELGGNIQTQKASNYFPTTSDISVSLGYRISDKSIIGVGTGYRIGLGKDIRHIAFSSEGMNMRSFVDIKMKGSIWITGGAELYYRSRFHHFEELRDRSAWSPSALAGLSKKYGISKKLKGELKLLYDVLWRQQVPQGQPLVFRAGYSLK